MLGQSEKSRFRSRLGAGLVAVGTVIALPLTATVTYAEAVDPVDLSAPEVPPAPAAPAAPMAPSAVSAPEVPSAPSAPTAVGDVTNITMLNGRKNYDPANDYVHKIQHNGRTVILRTDKVLSEKEIRKMVAEAEKSRLEADRALRESGWDREQMRATMNEVDRELAQARIEMQQELREAQQDVREAQREALEARREARQEAREAQREASEAAREAREQARQEARISSISFVTGSKVSGPDCTAMNKQIAMGGTNGLTGQAWAVVAGCGGFEVKIDKTAMLKATLSGLEKGRAEAAKCTESKANRTRKLKDFDNSIAKVKAQLSMT